MLWPSVNAASAHAPGPCANALEPFVVESQIPGMRSADALARTVCPLVLTFLCLLPGVQSAAYAEHSGRIQSVSGQTADSVPVWSSGLTVYKLSQPPSSEDVIVSQTLQDDGGNTRFRFYPREFRLGPEGLVHDPWAARQCPHAHRYRLQDRDLGQVFTVPAHLTTPHYLEAVTLRVGPMPDANEGGADGASVSIQFFEVHGAPAISDNGTAGSDSSRWRTFDYTRATTDDYAIRRMGESSRFEDVFFDPDDADDAAIGLAAATLPRDLFQRAAIDPGTIGYPDVDTYRDFVFYVHARGANPAERIQP
jgi:hypothetical protein